MRLIKGMEPPEFTRITFHSGEAKEYWLPKISSVGRVTYEAELHTVAEGIRECGTVQIPNIGGEAVYKKLSKLGLTWKHLRKVGHGSGGFSHRAHPPVKDENYSWFSAVAKQGNESSLDEFALANSEGRHDMIGKLLGFPRCCTEWFCEVWPEYRDPIWQVALNTAHEYEDFGYDGMSQPIHVVRLKGFNHCNSAMRYISARVLFHIPCSFRCEATSNKARLWLNLMNELDPNATTAIEEILGLPMAWDVHHGWSKTITPAFTLHAGSMECAERHIVRVEPEDPYYKEYSDIPGAANGFFWPLQLGKLKDMPLEVPNE